MVAELLNVSLLNESDTVDDLTLMNTSFGSEFDGGLHFLGVNLKRLYSSQKISLFCHNLFSTIIVKRLERFKDNGKLIETMNGLNVIIAKLPTEEDNNLTSFFMDMEKLLKEKKINGVSMVFYDNNAKKIMESYKFIISVENGEIKGLTDYNGNPIAEMVSNEKFDNDKKLFVSVYEKVYDYCCKLEPIKEAYIFPLFRFHFHKREDRKEYEKYLQSQTSSIRFASRPSFGESNAASLIAANQRKRFTYAIVANHKNNHLCSKNNMFIKKFKNKWNLLKRKALQHDSNDDDVGSIKPDAKTNPNTEFSRNSRTQMSVMSNITSTSPTTTNISGPSVRSKKERRRAVRKLVLPPKKDSLVYKGGALVNKPKKLESGLEGTVKRSPKQMTEPFTEFAISKEIKGLKEVYDAEFDNDLKITPDQAKAFYDSKNKDKNRNKNVPCLDATRVHLIINDPNGNDYIHANYIPTSKAGDRMIITQAPMNYEAPNPTNTPQPTLTTASDFYRMIEQEESDFVVMLCGFSEEKETMCSQYIPASGTINVGQYRVTTLRREQLADDSNVIISRIQYQRKDDKRPKEFSHLQYLDWPKEGFPKPWVLTPINIYLKVKDSQKPIIIHCTSGIRRSGTLASIFMALDELDNGTLPQTLVPIVKHIRSYRLMAVRTPVEFLYIHLQLIHYFLHKGYIENSQRLLEFFDDYDPAYKKQAAREKITQCVSVYGVKTVKTNQQSQNQSQLN